MMRRRADGGVRLVGVLHLPPLPGAPNEGPPLDEVVAAAVHDAVVLARGGADGVIVENFGDAPFAPDSVEPITVAAMTRVALAVRAAAPSLTLGLNVLRNDAPAALGIAAAVGADFVRVNVLVGSMVTDQGLLHGRAREVALLRRRLGGRVAVAADVLVKHAVPLGAPHLEDVARDTWLRAGADALIVTGRATGAPTDPGDLQTLARAVPDAPRWLGSGFQPDQAPALVPWMDAAIVGSWLHRDGRLDQPLDLDRVRSVRAALDDALMLAPLRTS